MTVVVAAHDISWLLPPASQLVVMEQGRVIRTGEPKEVLYGSEGKSGSAKPYVVEVASWLKRSGMLGESSKPLTWQELNGPTSSESTWATKTPFKPIEKGSAGRTESFPVRRSDGDPCLEVSKVTFGYSKDKPVLRDVDLSIFMGEIHGLVGVNGSGKTTLAKVIMGLLKPWAGHVCLNGQDLSKMKLGERARWIGYVPQQAEDLIFADTVRKEVLFGPRMLGLPDPEALARRVIEELGIADLAERHPDSLSGGQKRIVSVAAVCSSDTTFLILDEPEFGLDRNQMGRLARKIDAWAERRGAVLVVSQDLEAILQMCDTVSIIADGAILTSGSPFDLFADTKSMEQSGLGTPPYAGCLGILSQFEEHCRPSRTQA